jgi:peptidoglycan-associated lipoprotein
MNAIGIAAADGRRGRVRAVMCSAGLMLAALACAPPSSIGQTIDRGGRGLERLRGPELQRRADEADAARLYADARQELDLGRREVAQRQLELLVARYPDSALANVARRDLAALYNAMPVRGGLAAQAPQVVPRLALEPPRPGPAARPGYDGGMAPANAPLGQQVQPLTGPFPVQRELTPPAVLRPGMGPSTVEPAALRKATDDFRTVAGDRVFFSDNSADLGARARAALEAQAVWLARHAGVTIKIEGHADDRGPQEQNRQISQKRAEAVRHRLIELGVAGERIAATGLGREQPLADCPDPNCSAQNRRAVTILTRAPLQFGAGSEPTAVTTERGRRVGDGAALASR